MLDLSKWHRSKRKKWHGLNRNRWHKDYEITGTKRTELTTKSKILFKEAELSFFRWFLDNFNNPDNLFNEREYEQLIDKFRDWVYLDIENGEYHNCDYLHDDLNHILFDSWFLNGAAAKQYLDYLELKESRIAATQARKQSNISIWIAIIALLISTWLGFYSLYNSPEMPKPPFDVKVIEDKTRSIELEKENEK